MQRISELETDRGQLRLFDAKIPQTDVTPPIPKQQFLQTEQPNQWQNTETRIEYFTALDRAFYGFCRVCSSPIAIPGLDACWCAECGWIRGGAG